MTVKRAHLDVLIAFHLQRAAHDPIAARTVAALRELVQRRDGQPQCAKTGYPTEDAATRTLVRAWRSGAPRRQEMRAYHCDRCGFWHLTSQRRRSDSTDFLGQPAVQS